MNIINNILDIVIRTLLYIIVVLITLPVFHIIMKIDFIISYLMMLVFLLIVNHIYERIKEKYIL